MNYSEIELPSNKKVGCFFTIVFLVAASYFFITERVIISYVFIILAGTLLIITLIKDDALFLLNKLWMRFGQLIGAIISPVVLATIFFVVITPYSLVMHLFGRDELRLKLGKRSSHWKSREQIKSQTNFTKQY